MAACLCPVRRSRSRRRTIGGVQPLTNAEGRFRFAALTRGTYLIEASMAGFTAIKRDDVRVFVGQTITIDFALKIGKLSEEIIVKAAVPVVDVKDSQMNATNLDKQVLQTIGAEQRWKNSTSLINLAPGIKDDSAMGAPSRVSNQWQIDGQSLLTFVGSGADWNYPDLDIVSFGPNIIGAHSPDEKVQVSSVQKIWTLFAVVIEELAK
jgi:hypothetical protein